jgi:hypothetical protein
MTDEQASSDRPATARGVAERPQPREHESPPEQDVWLEEAEELPPRPRRRVITPLPLALLAALAIACGFIAGVLVEKGQGGGSSTAGAGASGGFASRLAALRGGTGAGGTGTRKGSGSATSSELAGSGSTSGGGGAGGALPAGGASSSSATIGQVAYLSKGTLYVTTSEGNTVKVTAAAGASVTKTVKASIKAIHPGETVIVAGASGANGAVSASSIRVGSIAGGLGGGAALFGGSSGASGASRSSSGAGSGGAAGAAASGGGEPQLFGKG